VAAEPGSAPARFVVAFVSSLRRAGVEVPLDSAVVFEEALAAVGLADRERVYWAGRATLVRHPEDRPLFDRVFAEFFDNLPLVSLSGPTERLTVELDSLDDGDEATDGDADDDGSESERRSVRYSAIEVLRHEDFARYDESEWEEAHRFIAELRSRAVERRSRRLAQTARSGQVLDLPTTVRSALATDGETVRRSFLRETTRPRRVVFLVDISGSMRPYSRAFLRLAHATLLARPHGAVEVFVLGTRLTRVTRELRSRDPDAALASAAAAVEDWHGGTRLGEGLRAFNDGFGSRGVARGAVVVVLSDGWDRGDPDQLGEEMGRLARLAHRVIWANPLRATPGYAPLARGMAAALPHVDDFVDGHSLDSLERLVGLLSGERSYPRREAAVS
jgi:uncharacterized protein with von Willebrand factor type A (vWA) domain